MKRKDIKEKNINERNYLITNYNKSYFRQIWGIFRHLWGFISTSSGVSFDIYVTSFDRFGEFSTDSGKVSRYVSLREMR